MKLDRIDLKILETLQREGRIAKARLAERVGLSASPCWERLRRLEAAGYIAGYRAEVDIGRLGPVTVVFMEVTLGSHEAADFNRFEAAMRDAPAVLECHSVGGGFDYLLKVVTRDVDGYQRLVDDLLAADIGISKYFSYIVTRRVKEMSGWPIAQLVADGDGR